MLPQLGSRSASQTVAKYMGYAGSTDALCLCDTPCSEGLSLGLDRGVEVLLRNGNPWFCGWVWATGRERY
jgi:hypothetical protein